MKRATTEVKSRTVLTPLFFSDGAATSTATPPATGTTPPAAPSGTADAPTPGASTNGDAGAPPAPESTPPNPTDENVTLTRAQLDERITEASKAAVTAAIAAAETKRRQDARKQQTEQQRKAAEESGDPDALLTVERTARETAESEVARLNGEVENLTRQIAVFKVSARHQLPPELIEQLENNRTITDEATAEAAAKKLAKFKTAPEAPRTDAGSGNRPAGSKSNATSSTQTNNGGTNGDGAQTPAPKNFAFNSPDDVPWPGA